MNTRRIFVINVVIFMVLFIVLYFGYGYYYRTTHYVSTDDATIQATLVPIEAEYTGQLETWTVSNGQRVDAGQLLGSLSTGTEMQQLGSAAKVSSVSRAVKRAAAITAPFAGTVTQVTAVPGQMVTPGLPLADVVDTAHPFVVANINETAIRHVAVGETVDIYVDAYPNLSLQGTIASIGMAANSFFALIPPNDAASGNYTKVTQTIPVKITLSGATGANLIPGSNVTVRIHRNNN